MIEEQLTIPDVNLDDYVRAGDPGTSHAAAASVVEHLPAMQHDVLDFLAGQRHGGTAYTAWEWLRRSHPKTAQNSISRRLTDLARAGLVEPTGETRPGITGRQSVVYVVTDAGREYLRVAA